MSTTGHENEAINVQGLKASLQKFKTEHVDGGVHPDAVAGNIIGEFSDTGAEFAYRPTAGAVDIESGQADYGGRLERVKGNTIAWNQLVGSGSTEVTPVSGRKIFISSGGEEKIVSADGNPIPVKLATDKMVDLSMVYGEGNEPSSASQFINDYYNWFGLNKFANSLPYDAEIEYIETTGTQYIDTGITVDHNFGITLDAQLKVYGQAGYIQGAYRTSGHCFEISYMRQSSNPAIHSLMVRAGTTSNLKSIFADTTKRHVFGWKPSGIFFVDNTEESVTFDASAFDGIQTSFALSAEKRSDSSYNNMFAQRIYACRIYSGTTIVRDLIPVRVGTVGYLYDKISGELLGNAGTGSFVLGGDTCGILDEPYDGGSLRSVKMTGIKTVGFNQWDEQWEEGDLDGNGNPTPSSTGIRSKNFNRIFPNTAYYGYGPHSFYIYLYDKNKNYLGIEHFISNVKTTPANAAYFKIWLLKADYHNDVCINLSHSGDRNGDYEPYWESTLNVPITSLKSKFNGEGSSVTTFPDGMKKAGSVYDEIVRRGDKTYAIKRIGQVDMGTLTDWTKGTIEDKTFFWAGNVTHFGNKKGSNNLLCAKYDTQNKIWLSLSDKSMTIAGSNQYYIVIRDDSYESSTAAQYKTAMSGVILYYELETPEEYLLDDFELPQNYDVDDYGTEEILLGTDGVAPILDLKYGINAGDTIKNLPHRYVSAVGEQNFTEAQKERARVNIGLDNLSRLGSGFGICSTDATVAAKEVTIPHFLLLTNGTVSVRFTKAVSVNDATLNVSGTGAKPILINDYPLPAGVIKARTTATLCYDGTNWNITAIMDYEQGGILSDSYVDMGLPSGLLWATANIDVTTQSGFAEVDGKPSPFTYDSSFFSFGNTDGHSMDSGGNFDITWDAETYANTDGAALEGNIPLSQDAARVYCGAPWRMPTLEEQNELLANVIYVDANGVEIEGNAKGTTVNGINGVYMKSKINGNLLFIPFAGAGIAWPGRGERFRLWSSTLNVGNTDKGEQIEAHTSFVPATYHMNGYRYSGASIRPVM